MKGTSDHVEMGNLTALLSKLQPSVEKEIITKENRNSHNSDFVENVASINVKQMVNAIKERSVVLHEMIEKREIGICGAMYNVETGFVEFYKETFAGIKTKAAEILVK